MLPLVIQVVDDDFDGNDPACSCSKIMMMISVIIMMIMINWYVMPQ